VPSEGAEGDRIEVLRLAVDQGVKSIEHQSSTLDSFHTRAGVLLGAGAAVTAFFGQAASDVDAADEFQFWLGLALFVGLAAMCILVLQARSDWQFTNSPKAIADWAGQKSETEVLELTAENLQERYGKHETQLQKLGRRLTLAGAWLVAEVLSFGWLLSTHQ